MLKFLILLVFFSPFFVYSQTNPTDNNIGDKWDALDKKIIFLEVEKEDGAKLLEEYEKELVKYFMDQGGRYVLREDWVFPLKNFTSVTHREEGNDYMESTYDNFQGSNTNGHHAHDERKSVEQDS